MNAREERGLIIAATCRLDRLNDGTWLVPSQSNKSGNATYRVNLETKSCTCLDHVDGGNTCKHFYAAKRKFGARVASKNEIAMVNEVLYKIICHNLSCLIMEQETLGIVPGFWKEEEPEERQDGERAVLRFAPPATH